MPDLIRYLANAYADDETDVIETKRIGEYICFRTSRTVGVIEPGATDETTSLPPADEVLPPPAIGVVQKRTSTHAAVADLVFDGLECLADIEVYLDGAGSADIAFTDRT